MNQWSTLALSINLFTSAFEAFRELRTPELLKDSMPYPLTRVDDVVSELQIGGPLPKEFHEERYYIMKGPVVAVALDTVFYQDEGLVNFSFVLQPRDLFKKRTATGVFHDHVIPYVREHVGADNWSELMPGQHFLVDRQHSLVLAAKFYFTGPLKSFGLAVTELKYSGLKHSR